VQVQSALGSAGDLALPASGALDAGQNPVKQVDLDRHGAQNLQSLPMHGQAVSLLGKDPWPVTRVERTLARWMVRDDPDSLCLLKRWERIVAGREWDAAVAETEEAQPLRQSSPLSMIVPHDRRLAIIRKLRGLKACVLEAA
jgi:hypothetical protein